MRVPMNFGSIVIAAACCVIFGVSAPAQDSAPASAGGRKTVVVDADTYEQMSPMGRLAHVYSVLRAGGGISSGGQRIRTTIHGTLAPAVSGDTCLNGDDDCSEEGFSEGPSGGQAEMAVAVDVTGQHIVVGFNDTRGFNTSPFRISGFAYSDDGGLNFTDGGQLPSAALGTRSGTAYPQVFGDPDIKYIPGGSGCQFVYSSIMVKGLGEAPSYSGTAQTLSLHRSTDCGHSWTGPFEITAATNPTGVLSSGSARDAADKELMDVDPETGRVMISWSNFTVSSVVPGTVQILATYSDNVMAGSPPTWSTGLALNTGSAYFDTGSQPRFAGNGSNKVYIAWKSESEVNGLATTRVAVSNDNGATFGAPIQLTATDLYPIDYILGNDRVHSFPWMAVDNSGGPNHGNVYIVASHNGNQDGADIMLFRSTNAGASFSAGAFLNSAPGTDRAQWFPVVSVDSTTGRVNVMWDDQSSASSGDLMDMMWVFSDDGGATWSKPTALTSRPFHAGYGNDTGQPNLGDYNMAVAQGGTMYAVFPTTPQNASFVDGEPASDRMLYPSFLGGPNPVGLAKATTARAALRLGTVRLTESGGNGVVDAGDQVRFQLPLTNFVTNPVLSPVTYSSVSATLSTGAAGVTIQAGNRSYAGIVPGATVSNSGDFIVLLAPSFVPGTKLDFTLTVTTAQGSTALLFTQNTGTPVPTTILSQNFDGGATLPLGWTASHGGGANTVPWLINNSFCSPGSNALFHANANDNGTGNPTRFERAFSPLFNVPADAEYVTVDFDVCYDTEDDAFGYSYPGGVENVLAYDGLTLRISDQTPGHIVRSVLAEAFAESIKTGSQSHYPKHTPRNSSSAYFQDMSVWAGFSNGFKHVTMRLPGMAGSTAQLRWEFTQDSGGTCADLRPGHACGVAVDNVVIKSVKSTSNELSTLTLRPVAGQKGVYTGTVTAQPNAPAGGITVNLASSNAGATTMPATVVIPAGQRTSPGFTVSVVGSGSFTITATGPSNARSAGIVVTP